MDCQTFPYPRVPAFFGVISPYARYYCGRLPTESSAYLYAILVYLCVQLIADVSVQLRVSNPAGLHARETGILALSPRLRSVELALSLTLLLLQTYMVRTLVR